MALTSSLSLVPPIITSPAKLTSKSFSSLTPPNFHGIFTKSNNNSSKFLLNATFNLVEPDLNEDPIDQYRTNGIPPEEFEYGIFDGHHTFYEGEENKGTFWGALKDEIEGAGPPTGFQGLISWLFPPAIAAGVFFNVPGEYLFIGAGIFTIVFCIIEMDKPDQPHHFEPQIYNMEREARDKLISEYNTMNIWDFNLKYGDIWDFTIKKEASDIMNR
ncbi:photosynthetic NDH subunit of subcomplex B 5, chloroplastic [Lathyrus oleraceus]|uniref:Photosynthetic NDH subunit of subcomplex B 5 n=1 Tax=Pisum sativum TaxID=3888 RepID=A0A9D4WB20_PEA|nr:photosynthetic NDH subunit of subcomplex B 5, chloroplastic [Pisum sativum]KAI5397366.1 Photosynthetic NDH subunit of subcomplex B 5 [Pisum sativum]